MLLKFSIHFSVNNIIITWNWISSVADDKEVKEPIIVSSEESQVEENVEEQLEEEVPKSSKHDSNCCSRFIQIVLFVMIVIVNGVTYVNYYGREYYRVSNYVSYHKENL